MPSLSLNSRKTKKKAAYRSGIPQRQSLVSRASENNVGEWKKLNAIDRILMATHCVFAFLTAKENNRNTALTIQDNNNKRNVQVN